MAIAILSGALVESESNQLIAQDRMDDNARREGMAWNTSAVQPQAAHPLAMGASFGYRS